MPVRNDTAACVSTRRGPLGFERFHILVLKANTLEWRDVGIVSPFFESSRIAGTQSCLIFTQHANAFLLLPGCPEPV